MCSHCGSCILSLKGKSFNGASCRVTAHRQRELLCVMAFQEMEWTSMDEVNAEDFDLSNITDDEIENEFGTPDFATYEVVPIRSAEIED